MNEPHDKDRRYWERHARRYDASLGLLGRPLPRMLTLVGEALAGAGRVLEVAAGTGLVTPVLARAAREVVATDYAESMVEELRAKIRVLGLANVRCERADIYALPFAAGAFDCVVAANVLHLVPDFAGALAALRRVLTPNGTLVAPTFCHDQTKLAWLLSRLFALTGFPSHRRFTSQSLRRALEAAGVHVTRSETLPGLIPITYVDGKFAPV